MLKSSIMLSSSSLGGDDAGAAPSTAAPSSSSAASGVVAREDPTRAPRSSNLTNLILILLLVCCGISLSVNLFHTQEFHHHHPDMPLAKAMRDFKLGRKRIRDAHKIPTTTTTREDEQQQHIRPAIHEAMAHPVVLADAEPREGLDDQSHHNPNNADSFEHEMPKSALAGLQCEKYGGPNPEAAKEMVYWRDIPSDQVYVSPFQATTGGTRKYMTFEPDGGGWNNIRMAMETVVGLAIAMGRVLVLPPEQGMYLLRKNNGRTKQRTTFSFAHFFPMEEMATEHAGLEIITMEQFLQETAMQGKLMDKETGQPSFPPTNRTDWNGQDVKQLKEWLRTVTYIEHMWKPGDCLAAFPASGQLSDMQALHDMQQQVHSDHKRADTRQFIGHPADIEDAMDRMHENMAGRKQLCVYDEAMQEQLVVHFMCYHKMRIRYLVHFYAFLYFEDWKQDVWMKRFMRDHMRYMDEIQCAAARIVKALRERVMTRTNGQSSQFDTYHIRRGDFQFKTTRIEAKEIYANSHDVLTENKTVYIATDERDKSFFNDLKEHYDVVFMDDFLPVLEGVNTNYYGMIDQLVAAKGETFVGCWFSTFTGFIHRMRGYYSTLLKQDGYQDGVLPKSFYYATKEKKMEMTVYKPLHGGFFNREFPTSWRDIDRGLSESDIHIDKTAASIALRP